LILLQNPRRFSFPVFTKSRGYSDSSDKDKGNHNGGCEYQQKSMSFSSESFLALVWTPASAGRRVYVGFQMITGKNDRGWKTARPNSVLAQFGETSCVQTSGHVPGIIQKPYACLTRRIESANIISRLLGQMQEL
jgi:hypothetical protein